MSGRRQCTRNGCTDLFDDESNTETSCRYHPGKPVFHDAMKGWSCCKKRVVGFDDFLQLPGCKWSKHTDEAPTEDMSSLFKKQYGSKEEEEAAIAAAEQRKEAREKEAAASVARAKVNVTIPPPSASATSSTSTSFSGDTPQQRVTSETFKEDPDPEDAVIDVGTACLHNACDATYQGEASRKESCYFHCGQPVFHEGSKGWSCCKRRVLDFDDFLRIATCTEGKHKFVKPSNGENGEKDAETVKCRVDFYQSSASVVMSIFAKKCDKEKSTVEFIEPSTLKVDLLLGNGTNFKHEYDLLLPFHADKSKYKVLGSKVEVTIKKVDAVDWPRLEK